VASFTERYCDDWSEMEREAIRGRMDEITAPNKLRVECKE
jgi:hypothetical protein